MTVLCSSAFLPWHCVRCSRCSAYCFFSSAPPQRNSHNEQPSFAPENLLNPGQGRPGWIDFAALPLLLGPQLQVGQFCQPGLRQASLNTEPSKIRPERFRLRSRQTPQFLMLNAIHGNGKDWEKGARGRGSTTLPASLAPDISEAICKTTQFQKPPRIRRYQTKCCTSFPFSPRKTRLCSAKSNARHVAARGWILIRTAIMIPGRRRC